MYGTLKKGFVNHSYLKDEKFISNASTLEKYQMYPSLNFAFPFLIKNEKFDFIKGEVFEVTSKEVLILLDNLEGYPDLYTKDFIDIKLESKDIIKALTYFKNEETNKDVLELSFPINEWTKELSSSELDDDFEF